MTRIAALAYGHARVRARKSRLLAPAILAALVRAERPEATLDGWRDLDRDSEAAPLVAFAYARLIADYEVVLRAYPGASDALHALLRLHELENVKLAWRAAARGADARAWHHLWRPMDRLEGASRQTCTAASTGQLAAALARTPYGGIAGHVQRAHGADLAAAEMTFDRWGSTTIVDAARELGARDDVARRLLQLVVCERDVAVFERATGPLGVTPAAALRLTPSISDVLGRSVVRWLSEESHGQALVSAPRWIALERHPVHTPGDLGRAIRNGRRDLCRRVFRASPYSLAPAVAFLLLKEDETRALFSIGELRARHASTVDAARALAFDG